MSKYDAGRYYYAKKMMKYDLELARLASVIFSKTREIVWLHRAINIRGSAAKYKEEMNHALRTM